MPSRNLIFITEWSDIKRACHAVLGIAESIGFSKTESASIVNAVSEIVTNVMKHATQGKMTIRVLKNRRVLEIAVADEGLGINNLKEIMQEGFTTQKDSLGIGLAAAKRAMDEFAITSKVGKGTTVVMKKYLPIPYEEIAYGVFSVPKQGEQVNGDTYVIKEFNGDSVLLAVIDGEGHGEKAYQAGILVKGIIEKHYKLPLDEIMKKCHHALLQNRGRRAVAGLCRLFPHELEYLGIGDTDILVITDDDEGRPRPLSHLGQLGGGKGMEKKYGKNEHH
ncbi:ATP-binding protein [Candidatus Berkelbacteria bacterium]|nr:ATP-binding protein [Candidatus Berkelbacteria bacterium]